MTQVFWAMYGLVGVKIFALGVKRNPSKSDVLLAIACSALWPLTLMAMAYWQFTGALNTAGKGEGGE